MNTVLRNTHNAWLPKMAILMSVFLLSGVPHVCNAFQLEATRTELLFSGGVGSDHLYSYSPNYIERSTAQHSPNPYQLFAVNSSKSVDLSSILIIKIQLNKYLAFRTLKGLVHALHSNLQFASEDDPSTSSLG